MAVSGKNRAFSLIGTLYTCGIYEIDKHTHTHLDIKLNGSSIRSVSDSPMH